jgi:hypothetical protein
VAIAVGSRGISNLAAIVKGVCEYVGRRGASPFIVPAMGSHGGATAEGQREILRLYGISEETIGAPVRASMEVVPLPQGALPHGIFMDRHAYESDAVILINRIKPHTDYHGKYESGVMKMALIGLGKLEGALAVHEFGVRGLRDMLGPGALQVLAAGKIVAGVGLVENALHHTMIVKVMTADQIPAEEPGAPGCRYRGDAKPAGGRHRRADHRSDGKNISGVGIDTNIIGRIGVRGQTDPASPRIKAIMVSDLTDESHGNAVALGWRMSSRKSFTTRSTDARRTATPSRAVSWGGARFRWSPSMIVRRSKSRSEAAVTFTTARSESSGCSTR